MIGIEVEVDRRAEIGGLNDLVEESTMICLSLVLVALVVKTSFEKDIMQQDRNRLEAKSFSGDGVFHSSSSAQISAAVHADFGA